MQGIIEPCLLLLFTFFMSRPLGSYMAQVLDPQGKTPLDPLVKPVEKLFYRLLKIDPFREEGWQSYLKSLLIFSGVSCLITLLFLLLQPLLPFNPENFKAPSWDLAINTAISFMSNTDWQSYSGETTLSYLSQMASLTVQNFLSPAVGIAAMATLVRGLARSESPFVGNFFVDITRTILYLLLPLSIPSALFLVAEGVPQTFAPYAHVEMVEGGSQTIALGPIASQEAIKYIGTNGGGFFNANSAHPYENPTPLSNFFEMFLMLVIPFAQIHYFALAIQNKRHGMALLTSLGILFLLGLFVIASSEVGGNPLFPLFHGNMEGKEMRFGPLSSALFAATTTAVSCGGVNCMHDSLMPMGGFIPLLFMQLSEVVFGGAGAGLYSVLVFVFFAIFLSGLCVGKTPEYLGKKIEAFEIKMTMLAVLPYSLIVYSLTALAVNMPWGTLAMGNSGIHGYTEVLYAFSSATANNGSAFAGLNANTPIYNVLLSLAMLTGRFLVIGPIVALGGSLAKKMSSPATESSFPVASPIFIALFIAVILLIGALTFLPSLTMGPIVEHFALWSRS